MPRARRPLGVLGAGPPAISRRAANPSRGVLGAASMAVATPRVAPGPARGGSRVAPAHKGYTEVHLKPPCNVGMASKLCFRLPRRNGSAQGCFSCRRKAWLQWADFFEAPLGKKLGGRYA